MKNSYTTLHRNLDTKIAELESHPYDNQSLIKDLKKKKLQLKDKLVVTVNEQLELFVHEEKTRAKKLMDSNSVFATIVKNFNWTNADQNSVSADIESGMKPEEAAQKWIDANPDKVKAWLG